MAVNVKNAKGEHIGIAFGRFKQDLLIALTEKKAEELFSTEELMDCIATNLKCKSYFKGINEEKLKSELKKIWEEAGQDPYHFDYEQALRFTAVQPRAYGESYLDGLDVEERIESRRYIIGKTGASFYYQKGEFILDKDLSYLEEFSGLEFKAVIGRVAKHPRVEIEVQGFADAFLLGGGLNDLGGANHFHQTRLEVESGNVLIPFNFPGMVITAEKSLIAVELTKDRIPKRIFTNGVIYVVTK